jgi:HAE1 family hydrophobic/amphiphilic exporter-1
MLGKKIPSGFVPEEDQGYFIVSTLLPDAASLERTDGVTKKIEAILKSIPEIQLYTTVNGNNLLNNTVAPNAATFFITLQPWGERHKTALDIVAESKCALYERNFRSYSDSSWPSPDFGLGKWRRFYNDAAGPRREYSAVSC